MPKLSNEALEDAPGRKPARCSFCWKGTVDVGALIEGPAPFGGESPYICRECVELCQSIFENEQSRRSATAERRDRSALPAQDLRALTPPERQVLRLRLGLEDGSVFSIEDVSLALGIEATDVRMILVKAAPSLIDQFFARILESRRSGR